MYICPTYLLNSHSCHFYNLLVHFQIMTVFDEAVNGYAELSKEFKGKSPNLEKCGSVLEKLKVCLVKLSFLPNDKGANTKVIFLKVQYSPQIFSRSLFLPVISLRWALCTRLPRATFPLSAVILPSWSLTTLTMKTYPNHTFVHSCLDSIFSGSFWLSEFSLIVI